MDIFLYSWPHKIANNENLDFVKITEARAKPLVWHELKKAERELLSLFPDNAFWRSLIREAQETEAEELSRDQKNPTEWLPKITLVEPVLLTS